jgi:Histone chaperone domain CHZ
MDEIDLNNIFDGGRRTRGRIIDFAKAAEEHPPEEDDDEDEEDDYQPPDEDSKMDED